MAIKIYEKFAPRANPADGDYPYGSIKNESVPGAKDGTPLDAEWGNDYAGFDAELFERAGIVPSGVPDKLGASQRVDALHRLFDAYGTVASLAAGEHPVGSRVSLIDRALEIFLVVSGGSEDGFSTLNAGGSNTAVIQAVGGSVNWRGLGVNPDSVTDTSLALDAAFLYSVDKGVKLICDNGTAIKSTASTINCAGKDFNVEFISAGIKLKDGTDWSVEPPWKINDATSFKCTGLRFDGNRNSVTGNFASMIAIRRAKNIDIDNTIINDLRRVGWSIESVDSTANTNCSIRNTRCDNIGVTGASLGEAIKCEYVDNLSIDGFYVRNTSGTGDGQVQKAFHCNKVELKNFDILDASPSKVYPAISNVRNVNYSVDNIKIKGLCQVAFEDNSNININYRNVVTEAERALIVSTDGAGLGDRRSENLSILNWRDTSVNDLAFNLIGIKNIDLKNLSTNLTVNLTRDDPTNNRRCENIKLSNVNCLNLNTLLCQGRLQLHDVGISGQWNNTSSTVAEAHNVTNGTYTNSGVLTAFVVRTKATTRDIQISGTLPANVGVFTYRAPSIIQNAPFTGEISAAIMFTGSPETQFSLVNYSFYDWGTPTVFANIVGSGATPRANVVVTVNRSDRTITFTNSENVALLVDASITFIDRG